MSCFVCGKCQFLKPLDYICALLVQVMASQSVSVYSNTQDLVVFICLSLVCA